MKQTVFLGPDRIFSFRVHMALSRWCCGRLWFKIWRQFIKTLGLVLVPPWRQWDGCRLVQATRRVSHPCRASPAGPLADWQHPRLDCRAAGNSACWHLQNQHNRAYFNLERAWSFFLPIVLFSFFLFQNIFHLFGCVGS